MRCGGSTVNPVAIAVDRCRTEPLGLADRCRKPGDGGRASCPRQRIARGHGSVDRRRRPRCGSTSSSATRRSRASSTAQRPDVRSRPRLSGPGSWTAVTGYADNATLFLLAARRMARPGGRVALLQPVSVFGARDASRARSELLSSAAWTAFGSPAVACSAPTSASERWCSKPRSGAHRYRRRRSTSRWLCVAPPARSSSGRRTGRHPAELRTAPSWSHLIIAAGTPTIGRRTNRWTSRPGRVGHRGLPGRVLRPDPVRG